MRRSDLAETEKSNVNSKHTYLQHLRIRHVFLFGKSDEQSAYSFLSGLSIAIKVILVLPASTSTVYIIDFGTTGNLYMIRYLFIF